VYDIRGRKVFEKQAVSGGGILVQNVNLNVEAGVYLVEVVSNGRRSVKKFVVN